MEGVLHFTYILFVALYAFDEEDNVAQLSCDCSMGVIADLSGCTPDCCPSLHVVAGEAAFAATGAASICWLNCWWFEMSDHQKIPKILW